MGKNKHFYAVSRGRQIGIYTCFTKAQEQVVGYPCGCQQGYKTLKEARQVMKDSGYHDPPIFDHRKQNVQSSSSESDLEVTLHKSNDVDPCFSSVKPVLVVEHPGVDFENLFPSPCRSKSADDVHSLCVPNVVDASPVVTSDSDTLAKQVFSNSCQAESDSGVCRSTDLIGNELNQENHLASTTENLEFANTVHENKSDGEAKKEKEPLTNSEEIKLSKPDHLRYYQTDQSLPLSIDSQTHTLLGTLLAQVSALSEQVKAQQNDLAEFKSTTQKMIEEQCLIVKQLNTHAQDRDSLLQSFKNHFIEQDKLLQQMICQNDQRESTSSNVAQMSALNDQVKAQHDNLAEVKLATQKMIEEQSIIIKQLNTQAQVHDSLIQSFNNHSTEHKQLLQQIISQNDKRDSSCQNVVMSSKSIDKPNHDSFQDNPEAESVNSYDSLGPQSDHTNKSEDILYHHPLFANVRNETKDGKTIPPTLVLPQTCRKVLFGDSNLKNVSKKRLDNTGSTEIRTFHNANILQLSEIVKGTNITYPNVAKVCISVGSVDCSGKMINQIDQIKTDLSCLVARTEQVFPNAVISILAIPPQQSPKANILIERVNKAIKFFFRKSPIKVLDCDDIWSCVDGDGKVERGIHYANSLLSERGLSLLLRQCIGFLGRISRGSNGSYSQASQSDRRNTQNSALTNPSDENCITINNHSMSMLDPLINNGQNCPPSNERPQSHFSPPSIIAPDGQNPLATLPLPKGPICSSTNERQLGHNNQPTMPIQDGPKPLPMIPSSQGQHCPTNTNIPQEHPKPPMLSPPSYQPFPLCNTFQRGHTFPFMNYMSRNQPYPMLNMIPQRQYYPSMYPLPHGQLSPQSSQIHDI